MTVCGPPRIKMALLWGLILSSIARPSLGHPSYCSKYVSGSINVTNLHHNLDFKMDVRSDIFAFFVAFNFSTPVSDLAVYGIQSSFKVSDHLWFVTVNQSNQIKYIKFDFTLTTILGHKTEIDHISYNGELLCEREERHKQVIPEHKVVEERESSSNVPVLVLETVSSLILGALISYLLFSVMNLVKIVDEYWDRTNSIVQGINRKLSRNNPNAKQVPLPTLPDEEKKFDTRGTYIELNKDRRKASDPYVQFQSFSCQNPNCSRTFAMLREIASQLPKNTSESQQCVEGDSGRDNPALEEEGDDGSLASNPVTDM